MSGYTISHVQDGVCCYKVWGKQTDIYMDKVFNRFIKEAPYRNSIKIIGLKIIEMQSFPVWLSMKRIIRNILLFG